jgi:hypothetical protein
LEDWLTAGVHHAEKRTFESRSRPVEEVVEYPRRRELLSCRARRVGGRCDDHRVLETANDRDTHVAQSTLDRARRHRLRKIHGERIEELIAKPKTVDAASNPSPQSIWGDECSPRSDYLLKTACSELIGHGTS